MGQWNDLEGLLVVERLCCNLVKPECTYDL